MSDRAGRYFRDQAEKSRAKREFSDACSALYSFLRHGDPSEFPALRSYLREKKFTGRRESYLLSGWGREEIVTDAEYEAMKAAYMETPAGKEDTGDHGVW